MYMMRIAFSVIVASIMLPLLSGCPCGPGLQPVELISHHEETVYYLEGTPDFSLSKYGDSSWTIYGRYTLPDYCHALLGPEIEISDSVPEDVTITFTWLLPAPGMACIMAIPEEESFFEWIDVGADANFTMLSRSMRYGEEIALYTLPLVLQHYRVNYSLAGPLGLTGDLTYQEEGVWNLQGTFQFPSSGYGILASGITIAESYPEQVTIHLNVLRPDDTQNLAKGIDAQSIYESIQAGPEANFSIMVQEYCRPE